MDRRAFLSIVAGSPFVLGLRELLAQEPASDFLAAALKRMKSTRRYGVVIVIPSEKPGQKRLGEALMARLPIGSKGGRQGYDLFCACVFVCLDENQAKRIDFGKLEGEGLVRILLNPNGDMVAADRIKLEVIEDAAKFPSSFRSFVYGADEVRLRTLSKAIRIEMPVELRRAVKTLESGANGVPDEMAAVKAAADSIAPWLVQKKCDAVGKDFDVFEEILWNYYLDQSSKDPEPCLPFGIRTERVRVEHPCPSCGLTAFRSTTHRFMEFLAK